MRWPDGERRALRVRVSVTTGVCASVLQYVRVDRRSGEVAAAGGSGDEGGAVLYDAEDYA